MNKGNHIGHTIDTSDPNELESYKIIKQLSIGDKKTAILNLRHKDTMIVELCEEIIKNGTANIKVEYADIRTITFDPQIHNIIWTE